MATAPLPTQTNNVSSSTQSMFAESCSVSLPHSPAKQGRSAHKPRPLSGARYSRPGSANGRVKRESCEARRDSRKPKRLSRACARRTLLVTAGMYEWQGAYSCRFSTGSGRVRTNTV